MSLHKHITVTFGTQIIQIILSLGISSFTTRLLGPAGKGEFAIFLASINLFALILGLGIQSALTYFIAKGQHTASKLLNSSLLLGLVATVFFTFFVWLFDHRLGFSFFLSDKQPPLSLVFTIGATFAVSLYFQIFQAILGGFRAFNQVNGLSLFSRILPFIIYGALFLVVDLEVANYDVKKFFLWYLLVMLISTAATGFVTIKQFFPDWKPNFLTLSQLKVLVLWGAITAISDIFQFLNYRLDYWLVEYFLDKGELGIYATSAQVGQMLWILPTAIASIVMPYTVSDNKGDILPKTLRLGRIAFAFCTVSSLILICTSVWFIPIMYGKEFLPSAYLLNILLYGITVFCLAKVYAGFLVGEGYIKHNLIASGIGFIVTIILDIILIQSHGSQGAAIASSISYIVTTAYVLYIMQQKYNLTLMETVVLNKTDISFIKQRLKLILPI